MERSVKLKQIFKSIFLVSFTGVIVGFVFIVISFGFDTAKVIKGTVGGFSIIFLILVFENFILKDKLKKLKFSLIILIRTTVYVVIIAFVVFSVWVIHESSINNTDIFTTFKSEDFRNFVLYGDFKNILLFSIVFSILINLFSQINNLLGKNVLHNYLTGKYHKPKQEDRAFMFLDLSSSTTIAEKLGPVKYHEFINSYFFDIDEAIVESDGEIYQYVGDEVVISWKNEKGFTDAKCIRCFFRVKERINKFSERYIKEFGLIPEFKAGLHCGNVVTGEIGDSKKEIVFHGDVLNTAARIQALCNSLGKTFLVSDELLNKLILPAEYRSESLGKFILRGKVQETELFSIQIN